MLISEVELAGILRSGAPVSILDVRWRLVGPPARADYDAGHLPGAVFVDLDRDLSGPPGAAGRHPLPDPEQFGAAMRQSGVSSEVPVVCYDERDGTSAARCWWLLRYFGHPDVSVLDGGIAAWKAGGHEPTREIPAVEAGDFRARPGHLELLDSDDAARVAREGVLLDARAADRYRGDAEPIDPVAGHIPGARSAPTGSNVDDRGRFLPAAELGRRFRELGVTGDAPVAVYCGSGVTAAHEVLALQLAGIDAGLYVGSWSEWVDDSQRPVATGPDPG